MDKIYNLDDAKKYMSSSNIIICTTIRNLGQNFLSTFCNIEILAQQFNNVHCIVFENDSSDNTRQMLIDWKNETNTKITKHIILMDNLIYSHPLRTHRLAYCRNNILKYIFDNKLNEKYEYVINCDADEVFWKPNFESICTCFQYDVEKWDVMGCVNKNKTYYDYWALQCDNTWFVENIFSRCYTRGTHYLRHKKEILRAIEKNNLVKVRSCFNGFCIYRLKAIKDCEYCANYKCTICDGTKCKFKEICEHIHFHKNMIEKNNANIFINSEMEIEILTNGFWYDKK